jgi:uncharacterized protein GlcG (DUF336 family)
VAVAVVDRGGNVQALLRDRFAGPHTPETAIRKAWTANSFRQSTAELAGLLEEKRIPSQVPNNPGALLVGGGLVIEAKGEIIGGIGVSGAPRESRNGKASMAPAPRLASWLSVSRWSSPNKRRWAAFYVEPNVTGDDSGVSGYDERREPSGFISFCHAGWQLVVRGCPRRSPIRVTTSAVRYVQHSA